MINDDFITIFMRINKILELYPFSLDSECLKYYNGIIFAGIDDYCGKYRQINISKFENILDNKSVKYADYRNIEKYVNYDIELEKKKDYSKFSNNQLIDNISDFTIRLWSTHPFCEGNTRTISVFIRNYLRDMGYKTDNNLFLSLFSYYRNALVMASYNDIYTSGDDSYLKSFYDMVIFNKMNNLKYIKKLERK